MRSHIKKILISLIGSLALAAGVSASGVFYYDQANKELVFDGNLSVDGSNYKVDFFEINSLPNENLFLNSNRDFQLRSGFGNSSVAFTSGILNSADKRIFGVDDGGSLKIGNDITTSVGTKFELSSSGDIIKVNGITSSGPISTADDLIVVGASNFGSISSTDATLSGLTVNGTSTFGNLTIKPNSNLSGIGAGSSVAAKEVCLSNDGSNCLQQWPVMNYASTSHTHTINVNTSVFASNPSDLDVTVNSDIDNTLEVIRARRYDCDDGYYAGSLDIVENAGLAEISLWCYPLPGTTLQPKSGS